MPKQNPERPLSSILITVDTARADRYGPYGYEGARTPIVDRLAKEGTTFEYAIVPMQPPNALTIPFCLPTNMEYGVFHRPRGL